MAENRHDGRIASYNFERGFGFIESKDFDQPLFFHFTFIDGGKEGVLYEKLYSQQDDYQNIQVSFVPHEDARGLQAKQVRIPKPFADIENFIKSPSSLEKDAEAHFFRLISFAAIDYIDSDSTLTQLTVQRIIKSPQKWSKLVALAKDWMNTSRIFRSISSSPTIEALSVFSERVAECLKLEPSGKLELFSSIPCGLQYIERANNPLLVFREAKKLSITILPDRNAIPRAINKDAELIISKKESIRLLILLDETSISTTTNQDTQDLKIITQNTIIRSTVSADEDFPVIFGRNLRNVFPSGKLQPYQVGSAYDSAIFSGRAKERERILEDTTGNYAVYGGRKIGKTWFLKDVCAACQKQEPYRSTYISFYMSLQSAQTPQEAARFIISTLENFTGKDLTEADNPLIGLVNAIRKVNKESGKIVLLALDELDDILQKDGAGELFGKLRGLQQTFPNTCKFVFAGFKELIHAFSEEATNNPFAHWIGKNHFPLGCLNEDDLLSLIVSPLKWVGYEFDAKTIVKTIFGLTSGHPYYTQSLCHDIVNANFENDELRLSNSKIEKLASDDFFLDVFDIFLLNLSPLQLLIGKVFSMKGEPFTESEIVQALKDKFGFEFTQKQIREEMKILQACSVFTRTYEGYMPVMQRINFEFFKKQNDDDLALNYLEKGK